MENINLHDWESIRRQMLFVLLPCTWFGCHLFLLCRLKCALPLPSFAVRIAWYLVFTVTIKEGRHRRNGESRVDGLLIWLWIWVWAKCWKVSWALQCTDHSTWHPESCSAAVILSLLLEKQSCLTQTSFGKSCWNPLCKPLLKKRTIHSKWNMVHRLSRCNMIKANETIWKVSWTITSILLF